MSRGGTREKAERKLTGPQKAAVLLITLGGDMSAEILKHMSEDEVQRIGREVALAQKVPNEVAEEVLDEYYQMSIAHEFVLRGGVEYARKLLVQAFGPETAKRMLDRMLKTLGGETLSFDTLQKADPGQLAKFIHSEHPQTIALILSHLSPSSAAGLLGSLPVEIRGDVAIRMANLEQISPDIVAKIANIIGFKLRELGEVSRQSMGGVEAVAEMFNRMDTMSAKEVMDRIEKADNKLGETIRHLMFVFEDLVMVDANGIKEVLTRVDRKILTVALKGTSDTLRQNFLSQMSQRGAEMLREDMEALGPVKIRDVESSQQQIIAVVRQLEAEGVINLSGGGSEQYVE